MGGRRHLDHLGLKRAAIINGNTTLPENGVPEGEVEAAQVGLNHGEQRSENLLH